MSSLQTGWPEVSAPWNILVWRNCRKIKETNTLEVRQCRGRKEVITNKSKLGMNLTTNMTTAITIFKKMDSTIFLIYATTWVIGMSFPIFLLYCYRNVCKYKEEEM